MRARKYLVALSLVAIMGVTECERPPGPGRVVDPQRKTTAPAEQGDDSGKKLKCELTGNERSECEEYRD